MVADSLSWHPSQKVPSHPKKYSYTSHIESVALALSTLAEAAEHIPGLTNACHEALPSLREPSGSHNPGTLWEPWAIVFAPPLHSESGQLLALKEALECLAGLIRGGGFKLLCDGDLSAARRVVLAVCEQFEPEEDITIGTGVVQVLEAAVEIWPESVRGVALQGMIRVLCLIIARCTDVLVHERAWELAISTLKSCYLEASKSAQKPAEVELVVLGLCDLALSNQLPAGSLYGSASVQRVAITLQLLEQLLAGPPSSLSAARLFSSNRAPSSTLCERVTAVVLQHCCSLVPFIQELTISVVTALSTHCASVSAFQPVLRVVLIECFPELLKHPLVSERQKSQILDCLYQLFSSPQTANELYPVVGVVGLAECFCSVQRLIESQPHNHIAAQGFKVLAAAYSVCYECWREAKMEDTAEWLEEHVNDEEYSTLLLKVEGGKSRSPLAPVPVSMLGALSDRWSWNLAKAVPFEPTCVISLGESGQAPYSLDSIAQTIQTSYQKYQLSTPCERRLDPETLGQALNVLVTQLVEVLGSRLITPECGEDPIQCLKFYKVGINGVAGLAATKREYKTSSLELMARMHSHLVSAPAGILFPERPQETLWRFLCDASSGKPKRPILTPAMYAKAIFLALGHCDNLQVAHCAASGSHVWLHAACSRHMIRLGAESRHLPREVASLEARITEIKNHNAYNSAVTVVKGLNGLNELQINDLHSMLASTSQAVLALLSHTLHSLDKFSTSELPSSRGARSQLATPLLQALRSYTLPSTIKSPPSSPRSRPSTPGLTPIPSSPRTRKSPRWSAADSLTRIKGGTPERGSASSRMSTGSASRSNSPSRSSPSRSSPSSGSPASGLVRSALKQELGRRPTKSSNSRLFRESLKKELALTRQGKGSGQIPSPVSSTPTKSRVSPSPPRSARSGSSTPPSSSRQSPTRQPPRSPRSPRSPNSSPPRGQPLMSMADVTASISAQWSTSPRSPRSSSRNRGTSFSGASGLQILCNWVNAVQEYVHTAPRVQGYWHLLSSVRELDAMQRRIVQCNQRKRVVSEALKSVSQRDRALEMDSIV